MQINLALCGSNGKMGQAITSLIKQDLTLNLKLALSREEFNFNVTNFKTKFKDINILIDFSTPDSCLKYLKICENLKIPAVVGTTGFNRSQQQQIIQIATSIPILLSPNMSVGINIVKSLIELLSKLWSNNFNSVTSININETHHKYKRDTPSGTALMISEVITKNFKNEHNMFFKSKRIGNIKGKHEFIFSNDGEELSLKHKVKDRKIFAEGAILAAKWLLQNQSELIPRVYSFSEILGL